MSRVTFGGKIIAPADFRQVINTAFIIINRLLILENAGTVTRRIALSYKVDLSVAANPGRARNNAPIEDDKCIYLHLFTRGVPSEINII